MKFTKLLLIILICILLSGCIYRMNLHNRPIRPEGLCPVCGYVETAYVFGPGIPHWEWIRILEYNPNDYVILTGDIVDGAKPVAVRYAWVCSVCDYEPNPEQDPELYGGLNR